MSGNIKVVVRCRPLNSREIARGATMILRMDGNQTILARPDANGKLTDDVKPFTFDKSYWSADKSDPTFATQEIVYQDLGEELLDNAFKGFNACIFAYGQTGAGKSYSMMGYGEEKGIIPKTCNALFEKINAKQEANLTYRVEVSYIEIYNEKVRDLLNPKNKENLKVREHPSLGPYVEDLSKLIVKNFEDIDHLMDEGNKARTVAATNMNETSSRSHAVFTVLLTQKRFDEMTKLETEKVSRISLVDLAGSERANSTGATGQRLKEGANINKSLTTLGKVIAALAEQSAAGAAVKGKKAKEVFIPYRDSVLTWLLKDSLGGNSKTAMIAAVSPASDNYDETLSTLRYADQAKKIKNKAVVNEDPNAKLIRDLKQELDLLRNKLMQYAPEEVQAITATSAHGGSGGSVDGGEAGAPISAARAIAKEIEVTDAHGNVKKMTREEVVDQLQASEKILNELNETWESKLKKTEEIHVEREKALEELGIAVEKNQVGVYTPRKMPHLVNLNEDPLMSECLVYQLKPGITRVGRLETENADIRLSGPNIEEEHCYFDNSNGSVTLYPQGDSMSMVNGLRIGKPRKLRSGYRVILGDYHVFRFNHPEEVRRERDLQKQAVTGEAARAIGSEINPEELIRPESPSGSVTSETVDWKYARREAVLNSSSLGGMKDEELEQLFDDVSKVRMLRRQGRPESRADLDDDLESRGSGSSFHGKSNGTLVDDESVFSGGSTIVNADYEERLKSTKELMSELMQQQLELQKQEYEEKMHSLEQGEQNEETEVKLRLVKDEMQKLLEQQKEEYELKLKRMSLGGPLLEAKKFSNEFPGYTEDEVRMVRKVLDKWRNLRNVHMAETVLTNAIVLKEANIISKELSKQVVYQFVVIESGQFTNPVSFWESTAALSQFNNNDDTDLISSVKPCVGVKVIDSKHQVVYYWSLEKLKLRLHRMRNLYNFIDRPLYRKHFNWEDPFYENPCPRYTFIGSASVGLLNLLVQRPYESSVVVISRITGEVQGYLRVLISPILASNGQTATTSEGSETAVTTASNSNPYLVHVGQQLLFEVQILELGGLQEKEFSQVHVQFKLSSFGNFTSHSQGEKIFATEPASDFEDLPIYFGYSQTLSMTITQGMMDVMKTGMLTFEVFGHGQPKALEKFEKWDDVKERHNHSKENSGGVNGSVDTPIPNGKHHPLEQGQDHKHLNGDLQRRPEEELLAEERHDILAWVQVCELAPDGEYVPVQVIANNSMDSGVFVLRQGLQRRIVLTLSHTSGRQFLWNKIVRVSVGRARLLDAKGRITESAGHEDILVNLLPSQKVVYNRDGTSSLIAQGAWDSSLHDSLYLNRITGANSRVLLTLTWYIEAEKCLEPIHFQMDIAVQIQGRDFKNPSKLSNLLASTKVLWKTSGIFLVSLKPPMTRKLGELWRMNTASKYVRGEEFLGNWKPRGVSLIQDYQKIGELLRRREAVDLTRQAIDLHNEERENEGIEESSMIQDEKTQAALIQKAVDLWMKKFGSSGEIVISQDPPPLNPLDPDTWKQAKPSQKLIAEVKIVNPTENVSKKGFLMYPENADDNWVKRWFVIRRPYMYIYGNQSESDEQGVINLSSVRVDYKKDLEDMLDRHNVFALYTNNNAYLFHASSRGEMIDWISKVDQFYPIQTLQQPATPPPEVE